MSRALRRFGTPAHIASQLNAPQRPPRRYSQAEMRDRRRAGLSTSYSGQFSLTREIAEVVNPLAAGIAAADRPARFCHSSASVPWLTEAVHELVGTVVGWVAEADAYAKTKHLATEPGKRRYAITTLIDLAQRPALPDITDAALADGSWAAALVSMAEGIDAAFSDLLARSYPPGAPELRGQASRSDQLTRLLGRTIDQAALALERRLDRDEQANRRETTQTSDERARAERESLGVQL